MILTRTVDLSIFFASELRAIIVNVDYRLAPEYKFPLPLNDCYQAVQWTLDHAQEYNIDTARIAIWGCSAGGNLAAAVALRDAEEHEKPRICHVNLVVPATSHPELYTEALKSDDSSVNKFDAGLGREAINILLGELYKEAMKTDLETNSLQTSMRETRAVIVLFRC